MKMGRNDMNMTDGERMGVTALGAYYRVLRENQNGITALAIAHAANVHPNYVWRIENGDVGRPGAKTLAGMTRALNGRFDQVMDILGGADDILAINTAQSLARDRIAELQNPPSPEEKYARKVIEVLRGRTDLLKQLNSYGDALLDSAGLPRPHP
jgi:transcriptional regulator with XRE-family HTH domain